MKNILVITGSRGEWGYLRPVLEKWKKHPKISFDLLATNMHLLSTHGKTYREIEADGFEIKKITPYLTVLIAILLVSKIPTLALKKISISPRTSVFLLLGIGIVFIALLFYTLETLLIFGVVYLLSIPVSLIIFMNQNKKNIEKISEESHEDIL